MMEAYLPLKAGSRRSRSSVVEVFGSEGAGGAGFDEATGLAVTGGRIRGWGRTVGSAEAPDTARAKPSSATEDAKGTTTESIARTWLLSCGALDPATSFTGMLVSLPLRSATFQTTAKTTPIAATPRTIVPGRKAVANRSDRSSSACWVVPVDTAPS